MDNPNRATISLIKGLTEASDALVDQMHSFKDMEEETEDTLTNREEPSFSIREVASLLGKTAAGITKAANAGKIPLPKKKPNGRGARYTLTQINIMREYWGLVPRKKAIDNQASSAVILSIQNFKGGVGKTTLSVHAAQYFAMLGYRVLFIDADSQGSGTKTFGLRPDIDVEREDTLSPWLQQDTKDLKYAIQETKWEGLHIIPASLGLYGAEYYLASVAGTDEGDGWLERLGKGIKTVEADYDIILIDPPPALGMISLSVLRAVDGLIIPTPPSMYDVHSTSAFFAMLEEVMDTLVEVYGDDVVGLDFVKVLSSKKANRIAQEYLSQTMKTAFGDNMLNSEFVLSAEVENASRSWRTVYDQKSPSSSPRTYKRCIQNLDEVFGEIEGLVQDVWRSRDLALQRQLEQRKRSETLQELSEKLEENGQLA